MPFEFLTGAKRKGFAADEETQRLRLRQTP
jgi:hypothetical protein